MDSIEKHTPEPELKHTTSKIPLLLTKPREEHSNELENVVKMVQKLSNKIVDMEKDRGLILIEIHSTCITKERKRVDNPTTYE